MKIGIIGGGIFGGTAAVKLAESGHQVDLYEKNEDLLCAASGINQYRLHRGYHYPRSAPTAISSNSVEPAFRKEYASAIIETKRGNFYAVAKEGSKVSAKDFENFCKHCELPLTKTDLPVLNQEAFEAVFKAEESIIDPLKLREILKKRLAAEKVNVFLNREADASILEKYDVVVNATYANLNGIIFNYPEGHKNYQFEICEKLVLKLPEKFKDLSVVIIDGPFMCIDPYADTGLHVMGNVVHAIHATNTGLFPEIPEEIKPLLNKGIIKNPPVTNFKKFIESAKYFMPEIEKAEHVGSMYTVRTVLPNVDKTDERPTFVYRVNKKIINIFSGKIGNSVQAAIDTVEMVERMKNEI